ncbi:hypothetical protein [Vulgatibacter incomptus]|nr:hypothetical protein [Vulgatibacter incomptus]
MFHPSPDLRSAKSASRTVLAVRLAWNAPSEPGAARPTPAELARDVVMAYGGRVVTSTPESLLAELESPTDTLQCAAALHDRFALERSESGLAVAVRAAVAAGEVLRQGRFLIGEAVGHANELVEMAAPGEVLFTQSVCLGMTRGEVTWEPHPGPAPEIGQPVHRLLAQPGAAVPALPFGGSSLARSRAGALGRALRRSGPLALAGTRAVARGTAEAGRRLSSLPRGQKVAAAVILATVLGTAWLVGTTRQAASIESALEKARPDEALRLADAWFGDSSGRPEARAWQGRVLADLDRLDEARERLGQALEREPGLSSREGIARGLVRTLDESGADRALLLKHRSSALERALLEATLSERYWMRWNSVAVLEKYGLGDRVDRVGIRLLDLQHAGSCGTRIRAAQELGKLGDRRALPALRDAQEKGFPGAFCNLQSAARDAIALIEP